jgi:NNP family nitrate/nitrite transporter-like MFS transporter
MGVSETSLPVYLRSFLPLLVKYAGFISAYLLWLMMLISITVMFIFFMKDAPYFQYKEMGIEIDKDALLLACGEELVPSGNMITSLKKAGSDYRTWILTHFYFVSFGGFIALTVWFPIYWKEFFGVSLIQAGLLTALYSLSASILRVAVAVFRIDWEAKKSSQDLF